MKRRTAEIGERIVFTRKDRSIEGVVEMTRENTVLVGISMEDSKYLGYENEKTVVNHSKYKILKEQAVS